MRAALRIEEGIEHGRVPPGPGRYVRPSFFMDLDRHGLPTFRPRSLQVEGAEERLGLFHLTFEVLEQLAHTAIIQFEMFENSRIDLFE